MGKKGPKKNEPDRRTHWGHQDVLNLVAKVKENWPQFCGGVKKKKFLWMDIAEQLEKDGFVVSGEECDRKWRNLKIRYLAVLERHLNGDKTAHRIDYFEGIHSFLKDDPLVQNYLEQRNMKLSIKLQDEEDEDSEEDPLDTLDEDIMDWSDKSVKLLLDLLLEFKDWFADKDNEWDDTTIWETISEQMKLEGHQPSPDQCFSKWCFLTQEYQRNKAEAEASGSVPLWPYYTRVRHVLSQVGRAPPTKGSSKSKQNAGSRNVPKRGTKRTRSETKSTTLPLCKKETPDSDTVKEEMREGASAPAEPEPSREKEPSSKTTTTEEAQKDVIQPTDVRELLQRLENIEENMAISQRLDNLEAQLDFAAEQRRVQQQSNSLLSQVLSELATLRRTLSSRHDPKMAGQDPTDLASGITIVVPHSQQL